MGDVEYGDTQEPRSARWGMSRRASVVVVAGLVLVLAGTAAGLGLTHSGAGASPPSQTGCGGSNPKVTVQGTGQASGTPDLLTAVFTFMTSAASSAAALTQNSTSVNQALLALAANGVARRDVQTTGLSLQPQYVYPKGAPVLTGYQVMNTVTASLRHLSSAGSAIDAVVGAVGNTAQISSLNYSFSNPVSVEDQARTDAVHQAVAHAGAMAAAAGRRLGAVCSLTDDTQPQDFEQRNSLDQGSLPTAAATAGGAVPVEPGTQQETDQVTMVYALETR